MRALQIDITLEEIAALDQVYQTTKDVRLRMRSQIILLAGEQQLNVKDIARIVRQSEQTVRNWLQRYQAEGLAGLADEPRSGAPRKVNEAYRQQVVNAVRQRPRSLEQPYSTWTLQRLVDYMAQQTGIRVSPDTVRLILLEADIVLSRPQHKVSSPDPEYVVKKRRLSTKEIS
jgi:transposase